MTIQDINGNPIGGGGTEGEMLGWVNPVPEETLVTRIYDFFIEPIRHADAQTGNLFLKRFLDGMQQQWAATQGRAFDIKNLWSLTQCPDDFLKFLKNILGWTAELEHITNELDVSTLRRLLATSVPFWKTRGPENSIADILRVMTGARVRVLNWFNMRALVGESGIADERRGTDLMGLSRPGEGTRDEMWMNVRIVDDGTLNHQLVKDTCALMRPIGERFEITYVRFLDLFDVKGDATQWETFDASALRVENSMMSLIDDVQSETAVVAVDGAADFSQYVFTVRFQANVTADATVGFLLYVLDDENYILVSLNPFTNQWKVEYVQDGVVNAYVPYASLDLRGYRIPLEAWCVFRASVMNSADGSTFMRLYLDGMLLGEVSIGIGWTYGSAGFTHSVDATIIVSDVEIMQCPVTTETIEINPT